MFLQSWIIQQAVLQEQEEKAAVEIAPKVVKPAKPSPRFDETTQKYTSTPRQEQKSPLFLAFNNTSNTTTTPVADEKPQTCTTPSTTTEKDCKTCNGRGKANMIIYLPCQKCKGTGLNPEYLIEKERRKAEEGSTEGLGDLDFYPFLKKERRAVPRPSAIPPLKLSNLNKVTTSKEESECLLAPRRA